MYCCRLRRKGWLVWIYLAAAFSATLLKVTLRVLSSCITLSILRPYHNKPSSFRPACGSPFLLYRYGHYSISHKTDSSHTGISPNSARTCGSCYSLGSLKEVWPCIYHARTYTRMHTHTYYGVLKHQKLATKTTRWREVIPIKKCNRNAVGRYTRTLFVINISHPNNTTACPRNLIWIAYCLKIWNKIPTL